MKHNSLSARQITTTLGLAGIAAIHIMDLPGKFSETPYLAWAYLGIIMASGVLIERIVSGNRATDFLAAAGLSASVIAGFVIDRTVGMPGAMGDIGNWFEPLGLLSLFVEFWALTQALRGFQLLRRARA